MDHKLASLSVFCLALLVLGCTAPAQRGSPSLQSTRQIAAEVSGRTVRLLPVGAKFRVPASWVERSDIQEAMGKHHNSLWKRIHYSPEELREVEHGSGEWDTEFAEVANAILPYESCAIHAGDEAWGLEAGSFADIQMRAYVGDWDETQLQELAGRNGLAAARRFSKEVTVSESVAGGWRLFSVRFRLWYGDYGGTATVEVYSRRCSSRTVAFVFMHCVDLPHQKQINEILDSFQCPNVDEPNRVSVSK